MTRRLPQPALALALAIAMAGSARATWSIVIADSKTGEIAIGTATCIANDDIEKYVPVLRVGHGVAAAQAMIDQNVKNRKIIFAELGKDTDPQTILDLVEAQDPAFQKRQFGIADLLGRNTTFTGAETFAWASGVTGRQGTLVYTIQGNILVGQPVIDAAQAALVATPGDVADKLLAAMEAARAMGGDGRCSCSPQAPTSCGAPPPSFTKSSHIGCMIIARFGDVDGDCVFGLGCATGTYYMDLNVKGTDAQPGDPDPVLQLAPLFQAWRTAWKGRPDHVRSESWLERNVLPADGAATTHLMIRLRDWQQAIVPLDSGTITVSHEPSDLGIVSIGTVENLGGGTFRVPLTAGTRLGKQKLRVVANDGVSPVTLYPFPTIATAPVTSLAALQSSVSTLAGGVVDFGLTGGPGLAGRSYVVLCSASGSQPAFPLGQVQVPLALDAAVAWSYALCGTALFPGSCGALDASGAAAAQAQFPELFLRPSHQGVLTYSFVTLDPVDWASNPVAIDVTP